ncbi:MAG: hypothetical protein JWO02_1653 [Solirubrobacterales bacterium]|nr:hypothetical protein [Solirubrobacterales bacterium]
MRLPSGTGSAARLRADHRRLRAAAGVGELFATVAAAVLEACGCGRTLVLSVTDGVLTASDTGALEHGPSDTLRRRVLAHPIPLVPGSVEGELVRRPDGNAPRARYGAVADVFDAGHIAVAAVRSDTQPLALLFGDRADRAFTEAERDGMQHHAVLAGIVLEHVVLRTRVAELAAELRELNTTSQALARDVLGGPVSLPSARRLGPSQARFGVAPAVANARLAELLTPRELQVAAFLVQGMPNRQIAEALVLSPNTVKSHVAHVLRKLGATNRMDAVSRLLRLGDAALSDAGRGSLPPGAR